MIISSILYEDFNFKAFLFEDVRVVIGRVDIFSRGLKRDL